MKHRAEALLVWLLDRPGARTTFTNEAIAAALPDVFPRGASGLVRVSEALRKLEADGSVTIERMRRHPKDNPSGRVVTAVTF